MKNIDIHKGLEKQEIREFLSAEIHDTFACGPSVMIQRQN